MKKRLNRRAYINEWRRKNPEKMRQYRQRAKSRPGAWLKYGIGRTRELARKRDNWTCQGCGKKWVEGTMRLDVHHLNGLCGKLTKKYDRIDSLGGLITLCHKCHFNRHDWMGRHIDVAKLKRNDEIIEMARSAISHTIIGRHFKVTRQRVGQILAACS